MDGEEQQGSSSDVERSDDSLPADRSIREVETMGGVMAYHADGLPSVMRGDAGGADVGNSGRGASGSVNGEGDGDEGVLRKPRLLGPNECAERDSSSSGGGGGAAAVGGGDAGISPATGEQEGRAAGNGTPWVDGMQAGGYVVKSLDSSGRDSEDSDGESEEGEGDGVALLYRLELTDVQLFCSNGLRVRRGTERGQ